MIYLYWFFNHWFKFQDSVFNLCHDLIMLSVNISDIAIATVEHVDYRCIIHNISKSEAINLLKIMYLMIVAIYKKMHIQKINIKNRVCNYHFYNLVKAKILETKNILVNKKNYQDMTIYFTRYFHSKSIKMLNLHYHELMGEIEEHEGKKYLMANEYMLDKVL